MKLSFTFIILLALSLQAAMPSNNGGVIDWRYLNKKSTQNVRYATARSGATEKEKGFAYLNSLRTGTGLITYTYNDDLNDAAQNHTDYLVYHNLFGHYEDKDNYPELFTGTYPWDRGEAAGYTQYTAYSENISAQSDTVYESIDGLISAIYHRFGFLSFNTNEIGIGISSNDDNTYKVYNYDTGNRDSISDTRKLNPVYALWPYGGYNKAQTSFANNESPDPLPECPKYGIAGNPISIEFNPDKNGAVTIDSFKLFKNDGTEITDTKILTKDSDPNNYLSAEQFVLFPMKSLNVDSRYSVEFKYSESGESKTISWHFNTKRYESRRYEVTDGNSYDVISGETYIIHVKPTDCTTALGGYSWNNSSTTIERLEVDLFRISATGDTTFYFPDDQSPELTFTLHIAPTDNAIAPSNQITTNIIPVMDYLLF